MVLYFYFSPSPPPPCREDCLPVGARPYWLLHLLDGKYGYIQMCLVNHITLYSLIVYWFFRTRRRLKFGAIFALNLWKWSLNTVSVTSASTPYLPESSVVVSQQILSLTVAQLLVSTRTSLSRWLTNGWRQERLPWWYDRSLWMSAITRSVLYS